MKENILSDDSSSMGEKSAFVVSVVSGDATIAAAPLSMDDVIILML
eukprot:CAMPEP_0195290202 /NCGR_PEP_ID=MMETSP0707-20130614/6163_1 /TAXON_ID=33640 /ORGANISM="Asterionellopsis glacialis, Strain CCMP134" /LENGTH=45 /DNA_ID= /DNA_START= /DNA_END= /DNA_ORIENTATION=